jgi:hypothetical protein
MKVGVLFYFQNESHFLLQSPQCKKYINRHNIPALMEEENQRLGIELETKSSQRFIMPASFHTPVGL